MRQAHLALGALLAAWLFAACGGGDDDLGLGVLAGGSDADATDSGDTAGTGGSGPDAGDDARDGSPSGGSAGAGEGGTGTGGASGEGGQGGAAGSGGTCGGAADTCPGVLIPLVGTGTDPRLGAVKGDSSGLCADYEGSCAISTGSKEAVYQVKADVNGALIIDTAGSAAVLNGYDPFLYVRSTCAEPATELACNDAPPPQADAVTLPVVAGQTVYVFVDAFGGSAGVYQVNVKLMPSVCGNGIIEPGEECDDQNHTEGDGCTAACTIDSSVVADYCPGGTLLLTGSGLQRVGTAIGNTQWLANDTDGSCGGVTAGEGVFSFTPDISGTATVTLGGPTQTPYDAVLYARTTCTSDATQLDCNDSVTLGGEQIEFPVLAGTPYYVFVDGILGATGPFKAQVVVDAPSCGNGKLEGGEECDDANVEPGDGCSPSCLFEPAGPVDLCPGAPLTLTQTGGTWTGAVTGTTIPLSADYSGACGSTSTSRDAVYWLGSVAAGKATISISNANFDTVLYARSGTCTGIEVGCHDNFGDGGDQVVFNTVGGSDYWVFVDGYNGEAGTYTLNVAIQEPECGNGSLEAGESCDDGNLAPGDGCDGQCQFEGQCGSLIELEPNPYNDPQVIPPACGTFLLQAAMPAGDVDYFQLDLAAGTTLDAQTFVGVPGQCTSTTDTVLSLWSSPMTAAGKISSGCDAGAIACDDEDSNNQPCSALTHSITTTAPYVLKVHNYSTTKVITSYGVLVTVR